jgi:hypothetical protein
MVNLFQLKSIVTAKSETRYDAAGLMFRYRPPQSDHGRHQLSVSRKQARPSREEIEAVKKLLNHATAVHNLSVTGPHLTDKAVVYYVYRFTWYGRPGQLSLLEGS